jgi:phage antirepressor YoqD-like protein
MKCAYLGQIARQYGVDKRTLIKMLADLGVFIDKKRRILNIKQINLIYSVLGVPENKFNQ